MKRFVILFLILGLFIAGCTQQAETKNIGSNKTISNETQTQPNRTVPPQQAPIQTYACPDGTIVTNLTNCPAQTANNSQTTSENTSITTYVCFDNSTVDDSTKCPPAPTINVSKDYCSDGTKKLACSITKPIFCDVSLELVEKASRCGCPANSDPYQDTCLPRCSDGTHSGSCSSTKPEKCYNGTLTDVPASCGCPVGYKYDGSTCVVHVMSPEELFVNTSVLQNRYAGLTNFDVTVVRAGYYEETSFLTTERYIRLDINIKNRGDKPEYLFASHMSLVDSNNHQYSETYGGTFEGGEFQSGVESSGSVLFDLGSSTMPDEVTLHIDDGYDNNFKIIVKTVIITLKN